MVEVDPAQREARAREVRHEVVAQLTVGAHRTFRILFAVQWAVALLLAWTHPAAGQSRFAIALILWGSAQVAEATRGAVGSIPREQHEAAAALGFGWVGRHRFVILPQAYRRLLPPLVGLLVNIIQNSTLAAVIGGSHSAERR